MKGARSIEQRAAAPARRSARGSAEPRCAPMPGSANQLERRVLTCAGALDAPLRGFARKYSPPVLVVALALQLNRLGRAHILAGLLKADDLRDLVMHTCDFASSAPPDSISTRKKARRGAR
jgi:hypothetical protein